ncbi:MAG TPA: zf-HC2 domain-containing protein [Candidatus Acidoferrum sp.]|nr:zf-HC2 domain-containing protein [Candidatus Acidoferrum sp.]
MGPHDRFLELCAVSTSGELTGDEQKDLEAHLAECADCRRALKEFEAAAGIGVPLLHSDLTSADILEPSTNSTEDSKPMHARAVAPTETVQTDRATIAQSSGVSFDRNGHRHMQVNWNYVWMPFAAAVVLTAALGIYSFQVGKNRSQADLRATPSVTDTRVDELERSISDAGHDREVLKAQLAARDRMIAGLRSQIADQSASLNETKSARVNLEQSLQDEEEEKQQVAQERSTLSQQLDAARTSLQKTQAELDSLRQQRAQDQSRSDSLEAQIRDLHGQLRDLEQDLGRQQELLAHDRDIRELMGARDLYIAEVMDVARDGQTQKPYGRVFYTKGKSLVFYAYDLDQQAGLKSASTFQAWGSHGLDRQQATSLGVFYQDNAAKKRWVVKFDDPKKLEQIDAVFVTVEPNGGSHKPSGKQLLFAYLKVAPNHP